LISSASFGLKATFSFALSNSETISSISIFTEVILSANSWYSFEKEAIFEILNANELN
jgi:hypothetical protein